MYSAFLIKAWVIVYMEDGRHIKIPYLAEINKKEYGIMDIPWKAEKYGAGRVSGIDVTFDKYIFRIEVPLDFELEDGVRLKIQYPNPYWMLFMGVDNNGTKH